MTITKCKYIPTAFRSAYVYKLLLHRVFILHYFSPLCYSMCTSVVLLYVYMYHIQIEVVYINFIGCDWAMNTLNANTGSCCTRIVFIHVNRTFYNLDMTWAEEVSQRSDRTRPYTRYTPRYLPVVSTKVCRTPLPLLLSCGHDV